MVEFISVNVLLFFFWLFPLVVATVDHLPPRVTVSGSWTQDFGFSLGFVV